MSQLAFNKMTDERFDFLSNQCPAEILADAVNTLDVLENNLNQVDATKDPFLADALAHDVVAQRLRIRRIISHAKGGD